MAVVNLLAALDERYGAEARAAAERTLAERGARLVRSDAADDRLAAWIDEQFATSWWSSEARAGNVLHLERDGEILGFAATGVRGFAYPWLRRWREERDVGIFGPYGVAAAHRTSGVGEPLLIAALAELRAAGYARALIPAVKDGPLREMYVARTGAAIVDRYTYEVAHTPRAVILASGGGTNAQAVLDHVREGRLQLEVVALIANDPAAGALARARAAGVATHAIVRERGVESRAAYDARLIEAVAACEPDLILLLGWMHLLPAAFLARFSETINVHPAFLPFDPRADDVVVPDGTRIPAFRGARAIQEALAAGARWTGASVHRVTVETDRGAILVRAPLRLGGERSVEEVLPRLRPLEHAAVRTAILRWTLERSGA